ncbi:hypothetical protein DH2020_018904 [Rehmannia glutinosa]|uniref:Retrotransposon gag domain-containing protein n=1 Tax=Rehmannia glutinosa TaxID=99300 RepID=A0ABR0WKB1_REHGL
MAEKWEEMLKEVSELKQRVLGKEVVRRGIPFRASVMANELLANFRSLTYEYDGTTDPWEHMCRFKNSALLHRYSDGVKCRSAGADSIASFGEFSSAFLHQFASSRKHQKTSLTLFRVKQSEGEPLRDYVKKFMAAALEVPSANQEILTSALTQGLKEGDFFRSLAKRPVRDFDDILSRAEKYVNLEEAQKGKKEELRDKRKERVEVHRDVAPKQFREQERRTWPVPRLGEPRLYTLLMASRSRVLMAIDGNKDLKWPVNYSAVPSRPKSKFFCEFHNGFGHTTEECRHLKDEIERTVKNGWLAGGSKWIKGKLVIQGRTEITTPS